MKKLFNVSAIVIAICSITFSISHAQQNAVFSSVIAGMEKSPVPVSTVNARALKNFKKSFNDVANASWYEIPTGLISKFEKDGIQYRLGFDKNGHQVNMMRIYQESQLPADIQQLAKSNYYNCQVRLVEEITAAGQLAYIIHLEDSKTWKKIKIQNEEINLLEEYNK